MANTPLLDRCQAQNAVQQLTSAELPSLCAELRERILEVVSQNGGHLGSNLGVVELTVALHRVFSEPVDQLLFDVGHQVYAHKLLTGRNDRFDTLRKPGGMSGFACPLEHPEDLFRLGHSSTSISMALGLARAKTLQQQAGTVIAVIGDGSFTGGLAFEGLNNAGRSNERLIVVLNDNEHSISPNVGGFARYLSRIRTGRFWFRFKDAVRRVTSRVPGIGAPLYRIIHRWKSAWKRSLYHCTLFEDLGFTYLGPVDGHDLPQLIRVLERAKQLERPVLLHVCTQKGRGYQPAEQTPSLYHAVAPFDREIGVCPLPPAAKPSSFSECFAAELADMAQADPRIVALTAAMTEGTGLTAFAERWPARCFDVGIAESHAVSFAAGLAKNGALPVFAVYSTFLQRAYDQLVHDVALNHTQVIFAVDRAGLVGADGETHQGVFDVAFCMSIPDLVIWSPCNYAQLRGALHCAVSGTLPAAIRYPKGRESKALAERFPEPAPYQFLSVGASLLLITYGRIAEQALLAIDALKEKGICCDLLILQQIKPIEQEVYAILASHTEAFVFEEVLQSGGVGESLQSCAAKSAPNCRIHIHALPNAFIPQGVVEQQLSQFSLDCSGMVRAVEESSHE